MKVTVNDAGSCRKVMNIEIPVETLSEERSALVKSFAKMANIPGFRKGRAPVAIVAKKFAEQISKELEDRLVPRFYQDALQETELKVVGVVNVSEVSFEAASEPVAFEVTVDVEPDFKLPKYEDIPVKVKKKKISKKEVAEQIKSMCERHATFEDVSGVSVQAGGMAQLEYEAEIEGKPLAEVAPEAKAIGKGKDYWVSADDYAFLPGMGEAIVGMKEGEEKRVEITFPEDFVVKELAGVTAQYAIKVTGIRERRVPELDEELLKKLGAESKDALEEQVRTQLEEQAEQEAKNEKVDQVVDYLIKKTSIEVPESVVQNQTRNLAYDIARQRMMMGMTQEMISAQQEDILNEAKNYAEDNVKLRYIGLAIAEEKEFEATPEEIDEEIAKMAISRRMDANTLRTQLEKEGNLQSVSEQVRFNKALDYLLENIKEK